MSTKRQTSLQEVINLSGPLGGIRTHTVSLPMDFESITSTSYITRGCLDYIILIFICQWVFKIFYRGNQDNVQTTTPSESNCLFKAFPGTLTCHQTTFGVEPFLYLVLVSHGGFKPSTYGLEDRCSIQLN